MNLVISEQWRPSPLGAPHAKPPTTIAVLPGDGIGKEVMPEGLRAVQAAAQRFGLTLECHHFDWAQLRLLRAQHGKMMPDDWKAQL